MVSDGDQNNARNIDFNRKLGDWLAFCTEQRRMRQAREREASILRLRFLADANQSLEIILQQQRRRQPTEQLVTARHAAELREWYELAAP